MAHSPILKQGRNYWRMEQAERLAFLVDGADYFYAFRETVKKAQHSVLIVGWDIDSQVELVREYKPENVQEEKPDGLPTRLGDFLDSLLKRNDRLHIHILDWDHNMIFTPAREWMPLYKKDYATHPRLHFHLDNRHPAGACHHQKIVVVDGQVAFAGGLDLTRGRWDTSAHQPGDPRRREEKAAEAVPRPHHDIQMMVSGPIAATLDELARERWRHATGEVLCAGEPSFPDTATAPHSSGAGYWPDYLAPDLENVQVAIARTVPHHNDQAEVREVEQLLLDAIAVAQDSIYIEAQYFTAQKIGAALAKRLKEYDGPEIIVLLPEQTNGWLPQNTMNVLRERLCRQLQKADRYNRLRLYCPHVPGLDGQWVNLHSKMTIIDNELVRVGSANLNNRSMGLDTECDLVLEAGGDPRIRDAIEAFRNRLLGEQLGVEHDEVGARLLREGSLVRAIESLRSAGRTVNPLTLHITPNMDALVPDNQIVDPSQPISAELLAPVAAAQREPGRRRAVVAMIAAVFASVLGLAALYGSPLREWMNVDALAGLAADFEHAPGAPLLALGIFVAGGLVGFPLTVLVIVCILVFGPWHGFLYSLFDALVSAMVTYALGHFLGSGAVRRLAGKKLNKLNGRLASRDLLTLIIVRIVPLASFTLINMAAGASNIRFRDFIVGSAIGLLPGILGISLFIDQLAATLRKPDLPAFALLAAIIGVIVVSGWSFWRWEERHRNSRPGVPAD